MDDQKEDKQKRSGFSSSSSIENLMMRGSSRGFLEQLFNCKDSLNCKVDANLLLKLPFSKFKSKRNN